MEEFAALLGQKGLCLKSFQKSEKKIIKANIDSCENVLSSTVEQIRQVYASMGVFPDANGFLNIAVSYDGSWPKRGHTSNYGFGAVCEIHTGLVVDYILVSKYCQLCTAKVNKLGKNSDLFTEWHSKHKDSGKCQINYEGSSNAMEAEIAVRLWSRSVEKHKLRYTVFLGDGDSKAFDKLVELEIYGNIKIVREECSNHAHKRMGTALLKLTKSLKLGGRAWGSLTQEKCLYFQRMYKNACKRCQGKPDEMRTAVWASLFHCLSTDKKPQHTRYPSGAESWCFYQRAKANKVKPPTHALKKNLGHPITPKVAKAMTPIYTRMSEPTLLKRISKGITQNPNESLHGKIWSIVNKAKFQSFNTLKGLVAQGVAGFNAGSSAMNLAMRELSLETSEMMNVLAERRDIKRIRLARLRASTAKKVARQKQQESKKLERAALLLKEGPTYGPGIDQ